jgi:LacI family transcriptional regulator
LKQDIAVLLFSGWDSPIPNVCERIDGYRTALREFKVPVEHELVLIDELSAQAGRRMGAQLIASGVTAAVLAHHETAKGTLLHFQDHAFRWPEDISLVMIGTPEWAGVLNPQLTCIQRPEHDMAVASANLLLNSIKTPDHPPVSRLLPSVITQGKSVLEVS